MEYEKNFLNDFKEVGADWSIKRMIYSVLPLLVILTLLELVTGFVLEDLKKKFVANPALLVLVPPLKDLAGNFGSVISSRISTRLHLGASSAKTFYDEKFLEDFGGVLLLSLVLSVSLSGFTYLFSVIVGYKTPFITILKISAATTVILVVFVSLLSVFIVNISYLKNINPDDIAIPIITNFADIFSVIIFAGLVILII